jgi:hypothetical protein
MALQSVEEFDVDSPQCVFRASLEQFPKVSPSGKYAWRRRMNDDDARLVGCFVKCGMKLCHHGGVKGVVLVWPVQPDQDHFRVPFNDNRRIGHDRSVQS